MIGQWAYELWMGFWNGELGWGRGRGGGLFIRVILLGFNICDLFYRGPSVTYCPWVSPGETYIGVNCIGSYIRCL